MACLGYVLAEINSNGVTSDEFSIQQLPLHSMMGYTFRI